MEGSDRALPSAAHLAQSDDPFVGLDLDDRAYEPPPVAPVRVSKGRLQGHRHGRGANVSDLHARVRIGVESRR